jgi:hypothetical protein
MQPTDGTVLLLVLMMMHLIKAALPYQPPRLPRCNDAAWIRAPPLCRQRAYSLNHSRIAAPLLCLMMESRLQRAGRAAEEWPQRLLCTNTQVSRGAWAALPHNAARHPEPQTAAAACA